MTTIFNQSQRFIGPFLRFDHIRNDDVRRLSPFQHREEDHHQKIGKFVSDLLLLPEVRNAFKHLDEEAIIKEPDDVVFPDVDMMKCLTDHHEGIDDAITVFPVAHNFRPYLSATVLTASG